jgi:hypothetical protein
VRLEFLHAKNLTLPTPEELEPLLARYVLKTRRDVWDVMLAKSNIDRATHLRLTRKISAQEKKLK